MSENKQLRILIYQGLWNDPPAIDADRIHRNRSAPLDGPLSRKHQIISRYKFTLAFENAISRDYVTEKFFDPLLAGSVPVYLGAPNVEEFAPGDHCFIDASHFDSPRALARYLMALDADSNAYAQYLRWKSDPLHVSFVKMAEEADHAFARLARHLGRLRTNADDSPAQVSGR
jgi:hypothetical protein